MAPNLGMWLSALLVAGGCSFDFNMPARQDAGNETTDTLVEIDGDPGVPDAAPDAALVDCSGWTATYFDACTVNGPGPGLELGDEGLYFLDTGGPSLTNPAGDDVPIVTYLHAQPAGPAMLIVVAESFDLSDVSNLNITGPVPAAIASWSTIVVDGNITVSAGANAGPCSAPTTAAAGTAANEGGGGGAGGSFSGLGGDGGDGDGDNAGGSPGTGVATPSVIRGGCPGGKGGDNNEDTGTGGLGGNGGGGFLLAAFQEITINGRVIAPGRGGGGGSSDGGNGGGGGGGGGSGGLIAFDAAKLTVNGFVAANSGGGGEGGDNFYSGDSGQTGTSNNTRATGGNLGLCAGGEGGRGTASFYGSGDGGGNFNGGTYDGGGGGGGGGSGYILVTSDDPTNNGVVSPPPS